MSTISRTLALCGLIALGAACGEVPVPPPRSLAVATSAEGVQLTWQPSSSAATEQWIERRPARGRFERIASVPADASTYHDADAQPGVVYVYRVLALTDGVPWNGAYSKQVVAEARPSP